jgi:hypothetical protein
MKSVLVTTWLGLEVMMKAAFVAMWLGKGFFATWLGKKVLKTFCGQMVGKGEDEKSFITLYNINVMDCINYFQLTQ